MIDYSKNVTADISDADLTKMCREILEQYKTGKLPEKSILRKLANESHVEIEEAVEEIIDEAHTRYEDVVILLMLKKPYRYLRF